jgi:hypothetical protein
LFYYPYLSGWQITNYTKHMRYIILLFMFVAWTGCKSDSKPTEDNTDTQPEIIMDQPIDMTNTDPNPGQAVPEVNIPAGPDGIVHHYICNDRCQGGHSENPGTCPVCGKQLAHNQAWHDAQNAQNAQMQQQNPSQANQFGPRANATPPQQQPTEQPQEVDIPAGPDGIVHHYICTSRCAGGHAEAPGMCSVCGKQLAHNRAWHNQ